MKTLTCRSLLLSVSILLSGTLVLASCDSSLEEDPSDFTQPGNFYRNAQDAVAAVNGAYRGLQDNEHEYFGRNLYMVVEYPTEAVMAQRSANSDRGTLNNWIFTPGHAYLAGIYEAAYDAINRANAVIDNVAGIEGMDENLRARIVAEGRFLRALNYFTLVRLFGGVPLVDSETDALNLSELRKSRASDAEIYNLVIEDLQAAIGDLPPSYTGGDVGRATSGAARTLLAKVYLTRASLSAANGITGDRQIAQPDDYQQAVDLAQQVIDSGQYGLLPSFGQLFDYVNFSGEDSEEIIFAIQAVRGADTGSRLSCHVPPEDSKGLADSHWSSMSSEVPFYTSYPESERKEVTFMSEYTRSDGELVRFNPDDVVGDGYADDAPSMNKFLDPEGECNDAEPDYFLLRYGELLLMKAEALNEANNGPTAEAYNAINQVRERAGLEDLSGLSYAEFREAVYHEMRWELVMEGHGWFIGQRFFDIFEREVEASADVEFPPGTRSVPQLDVDVIDPKHRLFPIPQPALDTNPNLTQNPGYGG